jgi:hypothetical protein
VVARRQSGLNRARRRLVRWEQRQDTYAAFLHLAGALLGFQHCDRFARLRAA